MIKFFFRTRFDLNTNLWELVLGDEVHHLTQERFDALVDAVSSCRPPSDGFVDVAIDNLDGRSIALRGVPAVQFARIKEYLEIVHENYLTSKK